MSQQVTGTPASAVLGLLRSGAILLGSAFLLSGPGRAQAREDTAAADLQALQGTWRVVPTFHAHGRNQDTPVFTMTFEKNKLIFSMRTIEHYGKVELNGTKQPKTITIHGPIPGAMKKGLYQLSPDGKTLTLALGRADLAPHSLEPHRLVLPYESRLTYWFLYCEKGEPDELAKSNPLVPHAGLFFTWINSYRPPGRDRLAQFVLQARQGQHDAALATLDALMKDWPDDMEMHLLRGNLHRHGKRDYQTARQEYGKAAFYGHDDAVVALDLIWLLAACPEAKLRDGKQALDLADKACAQTQEQMPRCLSARAAALAELGRFPEAAQAEKKALALPDGYTGAEKTQAQARLKLYEQGKPYRWEEVK